MPKPFVLNHALRIVSAVALVVSVMVSPIRPNASGRVSSPNHLRRNFGIPGKVASNHHRPHVPVPSRVFQIKAVSSESKLDCVAHVSIVRLDPPTLSTPIHELIPVSSPLGIDRASHALRC